MVNNFFFHIVGTYWFIKYQGFFKEYKLFAYVYQLLQNFVTGSN